MTRPLSGRFPLSFAELGLPASLISALAARGIEAPFAIQNVAIPDALSGYDVLGRASTGSGKTLAFGLPVLARLAGRTATPHKPLSLIMVPTRELAMQVADALEPLGRSLRLRVRTAVGGVKYDRQIDALRRGTEVLVATPGRLSDLCERGVCDLSEVEISVLDEADQMCDMGFQDDVMALLDQTPKHGQRLLFSATLDGDVDRIVKKYMVDPVTHSIAPPVATVDTMDHHVLLVPPQEKFSVVAEIANREGRTILFVRTQMAVDRVTDQLLQAGVKAVGLHGGKPQGLRTRTLAQFKDGVVNVLVATDVAARGIHVDNVSLVVHVDPPHDPKDYLHRAGRTARAGESGRVVTLGLPKQRRSISQLMDKAGVKPTETRVRPGDAQLTEITGASKPSYEPTTVPDPREQRQQRGPRRGGFRREGGYRDGGPRGGYRGARDDRPRDDRPRTEYRGSRDSAPRDGGHRPYRDGGQPGGFRSSGPRREHRPSS
nr:DEAD/DEAH box helicase [Longispora albida]